MAASNLHGPVVPAKSLGHQARHRAVKNQSRQGLGLGAGFPQPLGESRWRDGDCNDL